MRIKLVVVVLLLLPRPIARAQSPGFPFGQFSYDELNLSSYAPDSLADAVVLNEFGEASIDDLTFHLVFKFHQKIKILRQAGVSYADFTIPLYKSDKSTEFIRYVKATTYNLENGTAVETKFDPKNVFIENPGKYYNIQKFALPQVRVGSVIEVEYELESPFIRNFREWQFQSDIPKMHSEYWTTIPANYNYNIGLRGFLKLGKNESKVLRDCFAPAGAGKADCTLTKFAMHDIPAFKEEDYMTAKSNFLSALIFELSEIKYFDGRMPKKNYERI